MSIHMCIQVSTQMFVHISIYMSTDMVDTPAYEHADAHVYIHVFCMSPYVDIHVSKYADAYVHAHVYAYV